MKSVKGVMAGLCVLALLACVLPARGEEFPRQATVSTGGGTLNLRLEPDKKARLAARLENGQAVTVIDSKDGWVLIKCKGKQGWAMAEFVAFAPSPAQAEAAEGAPVFSGQVHIRELPDAFSPIVHTASGAEVAVTGRQEGWYSVRCADGEYQGYAMIAGPMGVGEPVSLRAAASDDAAVYRLPDETGGAAGALLAGQDVQVSELGAAWSHLDSPVSGYVKTALLAISPGSCQTPAAEQPSPESIQMPAAQQPSPESAPQQEPSPAQAPAEEPAPGGPSLEAAAPEPLTRQAALARALTALADRYLLQAGWEGGLTVQVTQADGESGLRYRIDLIGEDGSQTGQVLLDGYTGEVSSMFFRSGQAE